MDGTTSAKLPLSGITCSVWLWEPIWIPELYCALYVFVMVVHDVSGLSGMAKEAKAASAAIFSLPANPTRQCPGLCAAEPEILQPEIKLVRCSGITDIMGDQIALHTK